MKKGNVEAVQGGFSVKPTVEYTEKQARDKRIDERVANPKQTPTMKDIMDAINDLAQLVRENK